MWGRNIEDDQTTDAFLAESSLNLDERNILFARAELAQKSGEDLAVDDERLKERAFDVGKVQLGYVRQFRPLRGLLPGVGGSVSLNFIPDELEPFYGRSLPVSFVVFASLRPAPMSMQPMAMTGTDHGAMPGPAHMQRQPAPSAPRDLAGADTTHAEHEMTRGRQMESAEDELRRMHEIHMRMMADPVIRERVATDPVLQSLMRGMDEGMLRDASTTHAGHRMEGTVADTAGARMAMEFVMLLLSDPEVEARVHADPMLHTLWSDPEVQRCLETMRRLKASGQPLPGSCSATRPAHPTHR